MFEEYQLQIKVKVDAETGKLVIVQDGVKQLADNLSKTEDESKKFGAEWKKLLTAFGLGGAVFASMDMALRSLVGFLKDAVSEASEGARVNRVFATQMRAVSQETYNHRDAIRSELEAMRERTVFTDDDMKKSFATAIKFTGDSEKAFRLLNLAMNISTVEGSDLNDTIQEFGRVIVSPQLGMRSLRLHFGDLVVGSKDVNEAFTRLEKAYDGNATKTNDLDQTTRLMNASFREIQQNVGNAFIPVLKQLADAMMSVQNVAQKAEMSMAEWIGRESAMFGTAATNRVLMGADKELEKINKKQKENEIRLNKEKEDAKVKNHKDAIITTRNDEEQAAKELREIEEYKLKQNEEANKSWVETQRILNKGVVDYQDKIVNEAAGIFRDSMVQLVKDGQLTADSLEDVWNQIAASFKNMLVTMLAEYVAKAAMMGLLNIFTGGGLGVLSTAITGAMAGRISAGGLGDIQTSGVTINALDLRSLGQSNLNRTMSFLEPAITQAQKKR